MADKKFAADYIDVAERIAAIRGAADKTYPEGSFQPADLSTPFRIVEVNGDTFIAYVAAFYRTPDDPRPGIGAAWEAVPGKTPYTRGSELQNAETSAWGRALVAALAADTKRGIASGDEVRNRQAEQAVEAVMPADGPVSAENAQALVAKCEQLDIDVARVVDRGTNGRTDDPTQVLRSEVGAIKKAVDEIAAERTAA